MVAPGAVTALVTSVSDRCSVVCSGSVEDGLPVVCSASDVTCQEVGH